MAEAAAADAVPCGTHTPDQREDEPGLNQLWDAAQLFGGYFLEALGTEGTALGGGRNGTEGPKEAGRWGTSLGLQRSFVFTAEWPGRSRDPGEPTQSSPRKPDLGFRALGQPGRPPAAQGRTSFGTKGLKKQSSSLRRLMVRLLSVEAITSFTEARTKVMAFCRGWHAAPVAGGHSALLSHPGPGRLLPYLPPGN